jgi:hypothetical protein
MKKNSKKSVKVGWSRKLPTYQLARWGALVEGINIIADKAEERNVPFEKLSLHIPEIKRYIEMTSDIMARAFEPKVDRNEVEVNG